MKKVNYLFLLLASIISCSINARVIENISLHKCSYYSFTLHTASKEKSADKFISAPTDYFRSVQSGNWGTLTTWETSPDNGITPWTAATLVPTSAANTIQIRNGHTVTVAVNQDMDQVIIESGGILFHSAGTLTVDDGIGDDINVLSGGIFTLASNSNGPVFNGTATANISTGGMLRLSATGLTNAGVGVHAANFVYQHASVLEYTLIFAFASAGVTFFPNVNATTIPVFRITNNVGLIGGITSTTINGLFEANGNITFSNSGTKIFRNGIIGTAIITHDGTSGKFIINGTTASLGGTGSLTLPASGMDIGNNTTVTMVSNKTITGNIALLTNALVMLDNFNLAMTGDISGGSATSHVVTNGTGKLVINNITGATPRIFPIGANTSTITPIAIFNGEGFNYGARVIVGLNPGIGIQFRAVNRTWIVNPSGTPAGTVNVNFFYSTAHVNGGFNFPPATVELGYHTGVWNVINSPLTQFGGPVNYQVTGTVTGLFMANTDAPMAIGNLGAILAAANSVDVNYFTGIKQNSRHILKWKLTCNSIPSVTTHLERSADGRNYNSIYSAHATAPECQQPFDHTDVLPAEGANYYRLKLTDAFGKIFYSPVVVLINAAGGFEASYISPNPVTNGKVNLNVSTAKKCQIKIGISDMQGRQLQQQAANLIAGFNSIPLQVSALGKGTYLLHIFTGEGKKEQLRFVIQ